MVARPTATTNFDLPLRANGLVAFKNSFRAAITRIDELLAAALGVDGSLSAADVAYVTDDSNSTQAASTVQAELDAIRARLVELELRTDSNSQN